MLRRLCFLALGLTALTVAMALHAGEPRQTKEKTLSAQQLRELAAKEKVLQERYRKFEEALQGLHDRLAGGNAADKERAAKLKAALDRSVDGSVTSASPSSPSSCPATSRTASSPTSSSRAGNWHAICKKSLICWKAPARNWSTTRTRS